MVFSGYSGFLHQYNWNIVESGVKHQNPNPSPPLDTQQKISHMNRIKYDFIEDYYLCVNLDASLRLNKNQKDLCKICD